METQGNWWDKPKPAEPIATPAPVAASQPAISQPVVPVPQATVIPVISAPVAESPKNDKAGAIWIKGYSMQWVDENKQTYQLNKQGDKKNDKMPDWRGENIAAWERTYGGGKKMLTISLGPKEDAKKYVAFANKRKTAGSKAPDFWVFVSKPMPPRPI